MAPNNKYESHVLVFSGFEDFHLSIHSDMATVAKAMASPESGLEVRDRMWLKITIPNAFIGNSILYCGSSEEEKSHTDMRHTEKGDLFVSIT